MLVKNFKPFVILFSFLIFIGASFLTAQGRERRAVSSKPLAPSFSHGLSGDYREKIENDLRKWQQQVDQDPTSQEALVGLARQLTIAAEATQNVDYRKEAVLTYMRAADLAHKTGRILYTREISELLLTLADKVTLDQFFQHLLSGSGERHGERYVALVDYADALFHFDDPDAGRHFDEAIRIFPENNIEAYNRYAQHLLDRGMNQEALDLLNQLSPEKRIRARIPAFLRKQALELLHLDTTSADEEINAIRQRSTNDVTGRPTSARQQKDPNIRGLFDHFSHNSSTDDCRAPSSPSDCVDDGLGTCWYYFTVNLAEVLYNESRAERVGAQDMVGWTVRNRALQGIGCDSYPGGVNSSCRSVVPCSSGNPSACNLSRWYCCAVHGGTTTVGAIHYQFNDQHVPISSLVATSLIYRASDIINGRAPDISTGFIPPGISGCNLSCDVSYCSSGYNNFDPSPNGPMEYRAHNYCAAAATCKTYKKNVCGQLGAPGNTCTHTNVGDNHFYNRKY